MAHRVPPTNTLVRSVFRLLNIGDAVHVFKFNLTRILLKRAFSFGGKVTVGIVAVEIRFPLDLSTCS